MAGLLNTADQGTPPAAPAAQMPAGPESDMGTGPEAGGEEGSNVSPEEQKQYDQFVGNGMKLIFNKQGVQNILKAIKGDGKPVDGLANALVMVVTRLEDSAEQAGQKISPDVVMHGGVELLEQLADLAQKAGVHDFSKKELDGALYRAMDLYRERRQQQGKLPVDQLKGDFQQMQQAEQQGTLENDLPGITQFAQNAPAPDKKAPKGK